MPVFSGEHSSWFAEVIKEEVPNKPELQENIQVISYVSQRRKITGWIGVKEVIS
ncbi:ATP-binding protein [Nostoc cycadae WK-1]|uniref:ATP-binding protein n=2 Tax=Nostoc cycadae TaxID=246795 RepID=A0A2H6LFT5_9NOSO|nr:ATP-binding protein [Nostoc cycadae WK-1]